MITILNQIMTTTTSSSSIIKLSEEVESELEVLQAIYEDDFLKRPPIWRIPSFAIRIQPILKEGEKPVKVIGKSSIFHFFLIHLSSVLLL